MKKINLILLLFFFATSCSKTVDQKKQDLIITMMTQGEWKVTNFVLNSTSITTDFSAYTFKYNSNKTVDAIKSGTIEISGTWDGNASAMTTWANFVSPPYPLGLLNGTWHITKNSTTHVEASQTSGSDTKIMWLDKI